MKTRSTSEAQAKENYSKYEASIAAKRLQRQDRMPDNETKPLTTFSIASTNNTTPSVSSQYLLKSIPPIELFQGTESQDASVWLRSVEEAFDATNLNATERYRLLPSYFGDTAKKWYRSAQHSDDYDQFKKDFIAAFSSSSNRLKIQAQLLNRRQLPDEAIHIYYFDVLDLCNRLDSSMSDPDKLLYLIRGLKPSLQQQMMVINPSTPMELFERAKNMEAAFSLTTSQNVDTTTYEDTTAAIRQARTTFPKRNRTYDYTNMNQPIRIQQRRGPPVPSLIRKQPSSTICYNCSGIGHYAYQCPSHLN